MDAERCPYVAVGLRCGDAGDVGVSPGRAKAYARGRGSLLWQFVSIPPARRVGGLDLVWCECQQAAVWKWV